MCGDFHSTAFIYTNASCSDKIRLRRSAQKDAAGAFGLTIGVMLHVPLI